MQYTGPEHSTEYVETKHAQHFSSQMWVRKAWYHLFMAFLIYGWHTAPLKHLLKGRGGSSRADGSCALPTISPLSLGSAQPSPAGAKGQVLLCWSKAFQLQLPGKRTRVRWGGTSCSSLPPQRQAAGLFAVHMQTYPTSAHTPSFCILFSCSLDPSERGSSPLKWGQPPPSPRCSVPLCTASPTASSQPVSSIFRNVKLLNKYDECPLPGRAMPKTVSRSLTAKVILFVKKKGKHYH